MTNNPTPPSGERIIYRMGYVSCPQGHKVPVHPENKYAICVEEGCMAVFKNPMFVGEALSPVRQSIICYPCRAGHCENCTHGLGDIFCVCTICSKPAPTPAVEGQFKSVTISDHTTLYAGGDHLRDTPFEKPEPPASGGFYAMQNIGDIAKSVKRNPILEKANPVTSVEGDELTPIEKRYPGMFKPVPPISRKLAEKIIEDGKNFDWANAPADMLPEFPTQVVEPSGVEEAGAAEWPAAERKFLEQLIRVVPSIDEVNLLNNLYIAARTAYHAERGRELQAQYKVLEECSFQEAVEWREMVDEQRNRAEAAESALREAQAKIIELESALAYQSKETQRELECRVANQDAVRNCHRQIAELQSSLAAANLTKGLQSSEEGK